MKRGKGMEAMTDNQMEFITWLITTATDKCTSIEEVREMNEQIREHSRGFKKKKNKENSEEE